jgi:hypothetical protein
VTPFVISLAILGTREALLGRGVRRLARPATAPLRSTAELAQEKSDLT